eukprot:6471198-Amphidinium_carterae.2
MDEYMVAAPALIEMAPIVQKFNKQLEELQEVTPTSLPLLVDIGKHLPNLKGSLRKNTCDALCIAWRKKVTDVFTLVKEKSSELSKIDVGTAMNLFTEASIFFPLDSELQQYVATTGEVLKVADQANIVKDLLEACKVFDEDPPEDLTWYIEQIQVFVDKMESMVVSPELFESKCKSSFIGVTKQLVNVLGLKWVDCSSVPLFAVHSVECLQKVANKVPSDVNLKALACAVLDGVQLVQAQEKLDSTKRSETIEQDDLVEKLLLVHRRAKKLAASLERGPENVVVLKTLGEACKRSQSVVQEMKADIAAKMFSQCQLAHKALCDVAGGKKGGLDWCVGFEGKTFEELSEHAKDSLMKIDGGQMQDLQVALDEVGFKSCSGRVPLTHCKCIARGRLPWNEAFSKLKHFQGCFELTHNQAWEDELQGVLVRSRATKCNGCCLHILMTQKDPANLRQLLQKEIKDLRAHLLKEQVVLHPLVWGKVQKALTMRL